MKLRRTVIVIVGLLVFSVGSAPAAEFNIGGPDSADSVFFRSSARLEFIEGKTGEITGSIQCDPANMSRPVSGALRVDLRALKTGIDLRDQHMRERHLNTEDYPYAYFEIDSIGRLPVTPNFDTGYVAQVNGFFYIRGIKRHLQAEAVVIFGGRDEVRRIDVAASFEIKLDDYEIPRPKALFLKLAETVEIEVRLSAVRSAATTVPQLPDWSQVD